MVYFSTTFSLQKTRQSTKLIISQYNFHIHQSQERSFNREKSFTFNSYQYPNLNRNGLQIRLPSSPLSRFGNRNNSYIETSSQPSFVLKPLSEEYTKRNHHNNYATNEQYHKYQRSPRRLLPKPPQAQKIKPFDYEEMCQQLPVLEHDTKRRKVTFQGGSNFRPRSELTSSSISPPGKRSCLPYYAWKKKSSKILHLECEIKQVQLEMLKRFKDVQAIIEQQTQQIEKLEKQSKDLNGYLKRKRDY